MNGHAWSDDENEIVNRLYADRTSIEGISKALKGAGFKRSEGAVRQQLHVLRKREIAPVELPDEKPEFLERVAKVIHTNARPKAEPTWQDCIDGFMQAQQFRSEFSETYRHVKVEIKTDSPVALCCISDAHIGSPYCDYGAFKKDLGLIQADPRFYVLWGGDNCDRFLPGFRDAGAVVGQLHPATIQIKTEYLILKSLAGRVVAVKPGNHDEMDKKLTGIDTEYLVQEDLRIPYMPNGGLVELTVGTEVYRILWFHNRKTGNSQLNIFNVHRWLRMLDATADIAILEHEHNPGIETKEVEDFDRKRTIVNIRSGAYKINDAFSQKFFKDGRPGPQTVILYPDKRRIVPMHGDCALEDAQVYLNGLRKKR